MGRYTGPKDKLSRREKVDLYGAGAKLNLRPLGKAKRPSKVSEYGRQLREKQKAKRIYGIRERQFVNYIKKANKVTGNVRHLLVKSLECRLDNVIYRLGWAKTRAAARQYVNHGHVKVNGYAISIPSHQLKEGDIVVMSKNIYTTEIKNDLPEWLVIEDDKGKILRQPMVEDLKEPISLSDIIEFYSR